MRKEMNTVTTRRATKLSSIKKTAFWVIAFFFSFLLLEIFSSSILLYWYRYSHNNFQIAQGETSYLSSINLLYKVSEQIGFMGSYRRHSKGNIYEYISGKTVFDLYG
jgi:hypothetical protein